MERAISSDNLDDWEMYVTDPVLNKDGISSYTSYTLKGKKVNEPLVRRYRDFDSLRAKLVERWPGVYIPNIPKKKAVGSKDKEIVEMRIEMINRFNYKLSKLTDIFNSNEIDFFLQNSNDVSKTLNSLPPQTYEDLLLKYSKVFSDYDENNFNEEESKTNQTAFLQTLKTSLPKSKEFRDLIKDLKDKYAQVQATNSLIIDMFSLYEKDTVKEYSGNDDSRLVFYNMKNMDLCNNLQKMQEQIINPYDKVYDSITEDCLEAEAIIEALTGIMTLHETLDKTQKAFSATSTQLAELQSGKNTIKSVFSFKSRDADISLLITEKEKLEKNIADLDQVIKIVTFKMNQDMESFKEIGLKAYYDELSKLQASYAKNKDIMNELWTIVIQDKNIQNLKID